ncbi:hypothetical protein RI367_000388 [Sorochytrium milnesiophthora]
MSSAVVIVDDLSRFPALDAIDIRPLERICIYVRKNAYPTTSVQALTDFLGLLYCRVYTAACQLDKPLLDVDALLEGISVPLDTVVAAAGTIYCATESSVEYPGAVRIRCEAVRTMHHSSDRGTPLAKHDKVAVGGTFDHLHIGHKILLSATALATSNSLLCGVTDADLLRNKKVAHLVEPYNARVERVRDFLSRFKPAAKPHTFPLFEPNGPTVTDAAITALIVSRETEAGGAAINKQRLANGMPELEVVVIDLASPSGHGASEDVKLKISSTSIREWLVSHQQP